MTDVDPGTETALEWRGLGAAIRERRRARSWTMVELAARCELSQPFLSQVENDRAKPSMDSLYRIAQALDTTPQALFGGGAGAGAPTVVRQSAASDGAGVPVLPRGADSLVRLLLPGDAPFHVMEFVGLPERFLEHWQHDGFEAVYVLAGAIEIEVDGVLTELFAGDFFSYPARLSHRHRSVSGGDARVLMIETKVEGLQDGRPGAHVP